MTTHPLDAERIKTKFAEIRRQLAINCEIIERDHPDPKPAILPHEIRIVTGHVEDRLKELETLVDALIGLSAEGTEPVHGVDEIVTALYRQFRDWSKRGFGPDDVTWCEVKAEVEKLVALYASPAESLEVDDAMVVERLRGALNRLASHWKYGWGLPTQPSVHDVVRVVEDIAKAALTGEPT